MIRLARCFLVLLLAPLSLASGYTPEQKERLVECIGRRLEKSAYAYGVDFSQWSQKVARQQPAIDAAQTDAELRDALQAALDDFGTSHLSLATPSDRKRARQGQRVGIGITFYPETDGFYLTYVIKDSPAWEAGLRKGDLVVRYNGEPLESPEQFRGDIGDIRSIDWMRNGEAMSSKIRYEVFPESEPSEMSWLSEDVAIIRIHSFQRRYYRFGQVARFVRQARQARGIVFDLRNNRGGLLFFAQDLAALVTSRRDVFAVSIGQRHARRLGKSDATLAELAARGKRHRPGFRTPYRGIVVVLVDRASASAGDLFPASMQEQGRAVVIGERTSGNLMLSRTFRLPLGFQLYAPIAEILTPSGRRLESDGLDPDIVLDHRATSDDAVIFQVALDAIERASAQLSPSE